MKPTDIALQRLARQHLLQPAELTPAALVAYLGAVQSQDLPGAKWALGQRIADLRAAAVDAAIADGSIIRTHVLRPTWHFVAREDLRWLLMLTASRVHAANTSYYRYRGVDAKVARKARTIFEKALAGGRHASRAELVQLLERNGIPAAANSRGIVILMFSELDGVLCSGPVLGNQTTYALLDERVPADTARAVDDALGEMAMRYFMSRGPATVRDFVWWSGLKTADARRAIDIAGTRLTSITIAGVAHWQPRDSQAPPHLRAPVAHLLPNYDEYSVGFRDRAAYYQRQQRAGIDARQDALSGHMLAVNGQAVGGWRKQADRGGVVVAIETAVPLKPAEEKAVQRAVDHFGRFWGVATRWA